MSFSSSSNNPNPSTPNYEDDHAFLDAYLRIHTISLPSYRYAYLLWFGIALIVVIGSLLRLFPLSSSWLGARWNSWALRRRTWRKKSTLEAARRNNKLHAQPFSFPSNAQILSLFLLTVALAVVSFVGPDYVDPSSRLWQFHDPATPAANIPLYNAAPPYTVSKAWWTVGGRTGLIAFALAPLVIGLALKSATFAVFSWPFLLHLHFDKLARLHRGAGWLLWGTTSIHVATWGVQLAIDKRGNNTNQAVWIYIWEYDKFIWGVIAYFCLSILSLTSLAPLRRQFYETFYFLHVLLVPTTLVTSALHFPPSALWCWSALAIWIGERLWRLGWFAWINGYFPFKVLGRRGRYKNTKLEVLEMRHNMHPRAEEGHHRSSYADAFDFNMYASHETLVSPTSPAAMIPSPSPFRRGDDVPTPQYALAELLSGRAIRLRIVPARPFSWAPGQHILLRVPSVSQFTTHPFTVASTYGAPGSANEIVLLIRAKKNFTRELWNRISTMSQTQLSQMQMNPMNNEFKNMRSGVVKIRAEVDGPFGSSSRASLCKHSSILIVAGGSGVTYGISALEYLCLRMSGVDADMLGRDTVLSRHNDFKTTRVRFVWLVREYSHLQWIAPSIHRCILLMPAPMLTVEIYVANIAPAIHQRQRHVVPDINRALSPTSTTSLETRSKRQSWDSMATQSDDDNSSPSTPVNPTTDIDFHPLDYTNFDGDDDTSAPGEDLLSYRVHVEGQTRRRQSRAWSKYVDPTAHQKWSSGRLPFHAPTIQPQRNETQVPLYPPISSNSTSQSFAHLFSAGLHPGSSIEQEHALHKSTGVSTHHQLPSLAYHTGHADALSTVAELARHGKPNLKHILRDEVAICAGSLGVISCGPTSLNAMIRKVVAAQIDPSGQHNRKTPISLMSEDFEY